MAGNFVSSPGFCQMDAEEKSFITGPNFWLKLKVLLRTMFIILRPKV